MWLYCIFPFTTFPTDLTMACLEENGLYYVCGYLLRKLLKWHNCEHCDHWRRQGGPGGLLEPVVYITWNYLHFFYKISKNLKTFTVSRAFNDPQQLSLASGLPPAKSGRACYDNPTGRGYFYQMSNMYTCIAYLTKIRKFCSKKHGS